MHVAIKLQLANEQLVDRLQYQTVYKRDKISLNKSVFHLGVQTYVLCCMAVGYCDKQAVILLSSVLVVNENEN